MASSPEDATPRRGVSEQFKQKARDAGFVSLNDAWIPGVYVDMNRPVMGEFVKVARPMGVKSAQVVAEVDQIIRDMVKQNAEGPLS